MSLHPALLGQVVDILTFGQYLQLTPLHLPVQKQFTQEQAATPLLWSLSMAFAMTKTALAQLCLRAQGVDVLAFRQCLLPTPLHLRFREQDTPEQTALPLHWPIELAMWTADCFFNLVCLCRA